VSNLDPNWSISKQKRTLRDQEKRPMTEDITVRLTRGEPGPALIEAAQEIRQLRNLLAAVREENQRLLAKLEARDTRDPADYV
jgi:hypothetical protein